MQVDVPEPKTDPLLTAQEQASQNSALTSAQKSVTSQTNSLARLFGSSAVTAGSGMKAPILGL